MTSDVEIATIKVPPRLRGDLGDIEGLASSIARFGLLQPIVLDQDSLLVAGGRRLEAAMSLGWTHIPANRLEDLDEPARKEIELEENVRRKDLTWVEEVSGLNALYLLKQERYGKAITTPLGREGFGVEDAARQLDRSIGSISMDLQLARGLTEFPALVNEKTKAAAFKRYRRLKETELRTELARRTRDDELSPGPEERDMDPTPTGDEDAGTPSLHQPVKKVAWRGKGMLYLADSRDVLRMLPEASVDCIVTDPPYGLGLFKEGQTTAGTRLAEHAGGMYDDEPGRIMDMLDEVFMHAARLLKPGGHAYVFFHMTRYEAVYTMLRKNFGSCEEVPLIWIKNTPGIGDPNSMWCYAYEPCFWVNTGRSLTKPQAFNYLKGYDTVSKKIHPTEKPAPLLRHLLQASTVPGEIILDPFVGSGSTLVAAHQLGCRFIGVESHEPFHRAATERIAEAVAGAAEPVTDDNSPSERPA